MELKEEVARLRGQGMSFGSIASKLGITKDKARGLFVRSPHFSPPPVTNSREITIVGDCLVVGDVHVPYTKPEIIELVKDCAEENGIRQIAIVGDMFSFSSLSRWPTIVREPTVAEELRAAKDIMSYWNDQFDVFYMCMGNHDLRLLSNVKGELGPDNLADMFRPTQMSPDRLQMTMLDRLWWGKGKKRWLLAHQIQYSANKLTVSAKLAAKYGCNVLTHHQHHQAIGMTLDDKHIIADNGCLCSDAPYKKLATNSFPEWNVGFSFFKGEAYNFYWHGKPAGWKPTGARPGS